MGHWTSNNRRITLILIIANLCLLVVYVSAWTHSAGQTNKKTVTRPRTLVEEPLKITIEHRGQLLKENEPFDGDADWVRGLKFKLKNKSDKAITYVVLDLTFPDTASPGNARVGLHQIRLGVDPDLRTGNSLYLAAGESMDVSLDSEYNDIKKIVELKTPMENVKNLVLRLETAVFTDDTKWFAGALYRRNPNQTDPLRWVPINR
ncbi:MAG TPA: hypothetical protein VFP64_12590 [Pyrinomonadaceae bacterium]|nr:hypothetical protein [Pyrinomonadaceae bacterium]